MFNSIAEQKREEQRRKEMDSKNLEATARNTEEMTKLLSSMNQTLDLISHKIEQEAQLSTEQRIEMNRLLCEIKELILLSDQPDEEKESKMIDIIKKGLSVGGQASMALMIEFLKYKAKEYGFPMV